MSKPTPKTFYYNWLVEKIRYNELLIVARKYANRRLLDIGCGVKPYEKLFSPFVSEHIGLDYNETIHNKDHIDMFSTVYNIPVEDNLFDTILCSEVLEHLKEPDKAIEEANRVLKKNGYAIYTVPLFWHLHEEPKDFYRYTKYGLKYLFEKNGFEIVEIKALSGFWVTFGQEFVYYLRRFRRGGKLNPLWWLVPLIGLVIQGIVYILDHLDKAEQWTWSYLVVAKKK